MLSSSWTRVSWSSLMGRKNGMPKRNALVASTSVSWNGTAAPKIDETPVVSPRW